MGNGASTSHLHIPLVESDDQVCRDLYAAARDDDIEAVAKLLPLAKSKGVINKVRSVCGGHRLALLDTPCLQLRLFLTHLLVCEAES